MLEESVGGDNPVGERLFMPEKSCTGRNARA